MRPLAALATLVLASAAPAQEAPPADTVTLAEVGAMPPAALARRLLGAAGATVAAEARIVTGQGAFDRPDRLAAIELASAPRAAGFIGLCQADVVTLVFAPAGGGFAVKGVTHRAVFRAVDAGPTPPSWTPAYGQALDTACARTAPVLARQAWLSSQFFTVSFHGLADDRGVIASLAVRILADAAARVRKDSTLPLSCNGAASPECRHRLSHLDQTPFGLLALAPCTDDARQWCLDARADTGWMRWTVVTVRTGAVVDLLTVPAIRRVAIADTMAVE